MGQTTQAAGTALLSNGQSQALTSGWLSDATAVASVTTSGAVTGLANGRATIYIVSDGRQGQQVLRVTPDYHGAWNGGMRVTSCEDTGVWDDADTCKGEVGSIYGFAVSFEQSGESMSARVDYGDDLVFPTVNAAIRGDGTSSFSTTLQTTQDGVTFAVKATFDLDSDRIGELTGTVTEVWTLPNVPGEARYKYDVVEMNRTSVNSLGATTTPRKMLSRIGLLRQLRP